MQGKNMEKNPDVRMEKLSFLGTFGILKESLKIPLKNPNFITFTLTNTLPIFCTLLIHEILVKNTLSSHPTQLPPHSNTTQKTTTRLSSLHELFTGVFHLGLLYKVEIHLLNLLTTVTTVYAASVIYMGGRFVSCRDMLQESISKTKWKGPLITSIHVSIMSNLSLDLMKWGLIYPMATTRTEFVVIISLMVLLVACWKWSEFSTLWNMAVVTSVLEEKHGFEALSSSWHISKGSRLRGLCLMLFHAIWWLSVRFPSFNLHVRENEREGVGDGIVKAFVQLGLVCLGKVVKWVACMVYYYDCKKRYEKIDLEEGEGNGAFYTDLQ